MSIHKSLKRSGAMARARNVLTRWERLQQLITEERWSEGDPVYGLPKVRVLVAQARGKKKKKKEEKEEGAE